MAATSSHGPRLETGLPFGAFNRAPYVAQLTDWLSRLSTFLNARGLHGLLRWEQRSLPVVSDLLLALLFALVLPLVRWGLECTLFECAAQSALSSQKAPASQVGQERSKLAVVKFKESAWKCFFYGSVWLFGMAMTRSEEWVGTDTRMLWDGWPHYTVTPGVKLFYMLELAYYLLGIALVGTSLVRPEVTWEVKRKDSLVMLTHHIATALLLAVSYLNGFVRIGVLVLLVHDLSDVLLEGAKLCKYGGKETAASFAFGAFAVSFFSLRLVYYPAVLIYSASFEAPRSVGKVLSGRTTKLCYYTFNTSLNLVLVLHCYWFMLIVRIIHKQIASGCVDDVRSDSEDD